MDDLISRQMTIDAVLKLTYADGAYGYADAKELVDSLEALPSAQPEIKAGRWIMRSLNPPYPAWERYICSNCGNYANDYDFCPYCGAKMLKTEN